MFNPFRRSPAQSTVAQGQAVETLALQFLQGHGHRLVARNFRCRQGEIDLITLEQQVLVFTEVRYRKRSDFGGAALSVDARKQARLIQAARHFLHRHPEYQHIDCRFDMIAFEADAPPQWYKNAFQT